MPRNSQEITDAVMRVVLTSGVGPVTFHRLKSHFSTFEDIVSASASMLCEVEGIVKKRADSIRREMDKAECANERELMADENVRMVIFGDSDYPPLLAAIPDPPVAIWIKGELEEKDQIAVAIVGSRRCTAYGREQAGRFSSLLAQSGLTIVSGGARGIDSEAHRAALRVNGRTIIVCGCGLSHIYPPEHEDLFNRVVIEGGAIVSEFPMMVQPRAEHFPRRNRIISGLSLGVLVIEAGKGSGALITAKMAAEDHGREVMAVPGRLDSPASFGCLKAIREGWAGMVLDHADVMLQLDTSLHLLHGAIESSPAFDKEPNQPPLIEANLTDQQKRIVEALKDSGSPMLPDHIAASTQLPMQQIMADLTLLQIRNVIARNEKGIRLKQNTPA